VTVTETTICSHRIGVNPQMAWNKDKDDEFAQE